MLKVVNISKSYFLPGQDTPLAVLKGINLEIGPAESVAIAGPSGSGKSTLLNIIGTLDKPDAGKVFLDGRDLAGLDEDNLARVRNVEIGFVFQLHHLLPQCTVFENVLIPSLAGYVSISKKDIQQRALELFERVGLMDCLEKKPGQLSGGQRQRVAVVRALINKPKLLLADEPTGSLDKYTAKSIAELLVDLNRTERVALILVTHSMSLAEKMDRCIYLSDGILKDRIDY